jgi:transcriptional regulator with XRE-family HTH domain
MMSQWKHQAAVLERVQNRTGRPGTLADLGELSVGERIKTLREEREWTAKRLAEESERTGAPSLTRSALAKVEAGLRRLRPEEAIALASIFGVPVELLLRASQSREPGAREHLTDERSVPLMTAGPDELGGATAENGRRAELDQLIAGLRNAWGPHFWLVIGPPGIGKSVLATQLLREAERLEEGWATRRLDVRTQEPSARANAEVLMSRMFGPDPARPGDTAADGQAFEDPSPYRAIARRISRENKPLLCVLDSADELSDGVSRQLRSGMSAVYDHVQGAGKPDIRLAFVVASRLEDGWRGVMPTPKPEVLAVPELGVDVVEHRLREAAGPDRAGGYSARQFAEMAELVHEVTAGLPRLLDPFLSWISDEEWLEINRLEDAEVFEPLARPYIDDTLLAPESLFPRTDKVPREHLTVLRTAIRYLVRYRFFTRSHVWYHLDKDPDFRQSLNRADWTPEELWTALSGTALLKKPLDELWQEFHPAIRRLLFRHSYKSGAQRVAAHEDAREFVTKWADGQPPKERVIGRMEGLWHAASALRLSEGDDIREQLVAAARQAGSGLGDSDLYTVSDLSAYAAERIARDTELLAALADIDGLAAELNDAMMAWT